MARAPRTWLYLACLWLSMATVLGHALAPVGSPLARTSGSAFSASTTDVALGPARPASAKLQRMQADDESGAASGADLLLPPPQFAALPQPWSGAFAFHPAPADPAPSFPRSQGFDARAPPQRA